MNNLDLIVSTFVDPSFSVAYAVCFFVFLFEFAGNTWSKTYVSSFYPKFEYTGKMIILYIILLFLRYVVLNSEISLLLFIVDNVTSLTFAVLISSSFTFTGFLFTFFWWLDLLAILSLFPDVTFIGEPIGISSMTNSTSSESNFTKAGRVVRLVRLVRLIKVYILSNFCVLFAVQGEPC